MLYFFICSILMLFNFATLNVNGLGNTAKRKNVFNFLREKKVNIIFLQETHRVMEIEKQWSCEWNGEVLYSHGRSRSKGVAILFNKNPQFCCKINRIFRDDQGRILIVDIDVNDHHFALANIYGPNMDDPNFFSQFLCLIRFIHLLELICCLAVILT